MNNKINYLRVREGREFSQLESLLPTLSDKYWFYLNVKMTDALGMKVKGTIECPHKRPGEPSVQLIVLQKYIVIHGFSSRINSDKTSAETCLFPTCLKVHRIYEMF